MLNDPLFFYKDLTFPLKLEELEIGKEINWKYFSTFPSSLKSLDVTVKMNNLIPSLPFINLEKLIIRAIIDDGAYKFLEKLLGAFFCFIF